MKKLSLNPEELVVESFGTVASSRARGTVRGAAGTLAGTCTCRDTDFDCPDTDFDCPNTDYDCPDTLNWSCPRTCGIMPAAGDAMAPGSYNCPCM